MCEIPVSVGWYLSEYRNDIMDKKNLSGLIDIRSYSTWVRGLSTIVEFIKPLNRTFMELSTIVEIIKSL